MGFGSKERDFWCFARGENGEREPKIKYGGGGGEGSYSFFLVQSSLPLQKAEDFIG